MNNTMKHQDRTQRGDRLPSVSDSSGRARLLLLWLLGIPLPIILVIWLFAGGC